MVVEMIPDTNLLVLLFNMTTPIKVECSNSICSTWAIIVLGASGRCKQIGIAADLGCLKKM